MKASRTRSLVAAFLSGIAMLTASAPARAGIPVIDVAGLIQAVLDVLNGITTVQNQYQQLVGQVQQIQGLGKQVEAISKARSLGDVLNNPLLQNYVPRQTRDLVRSIETGGYRSLTGLGKTLRDAQMTYNCMDITELTIRTNCQASLAKPYQQKAVMDEALVASKNRIDQINALMQRAGATVDQKEIQEVSARISGEIALLQHEAGQVELMRGLAEADARVEETRAKEGKLEQLSRTRPLSDFL